MVSVSACGDDAKTVSGVVVAVEGTLDEVTAFTVLVQGEQVTFLPAPDGEFAFPLSHLRDHLRSGEPVIVEWELVGGIRFAVSIDDG